VAPHNHLPGTAGLIRTFSPAPPISLHIPIAFLGWSHSLQKVGQVIPAVTLPAALAAFQSADIGTQPRNVRFLPKLDVAYRNKCLSQSRKFSSAQPNT
jgi:hypothetical protein